MTITREKLKKTIDKIPERDVMEVYDFIGYLNLKRVRKSYQHMEKANMTSTKFWDNSVDDEVWNDV